MESPDRIFHKSPEPLHPPIPFLNFIEFFGAWWKILICSARSEAVCLTASGLAKKEKKILLATFFNDELFLLSLTSACLLFPCPTRKIITISSICLTTESKNIPSIFLCVCPGQTFRNFRGSQAMFLSFVSFMDMRILRILNIWSVGFSIHRACRWNSMSKNCPEIVCQISHIETRW